MSAVPAAVWYFGTVNVNSGFIIANFGRTFLVPHPSFWFVLRFVITDPLSISDPVAAIVSIDPSGSASVTFAFPKTISQGSASVFVPAAISFEQSITDPPPTARMKSTCSSLAIFIPFSADSILGFGSMPDSST